MEFNKFVNNIYGNGSIQDLFDSNMSDVQKIQYIDEWWQDWQNNEGNPKKNDF